MPFGASYGVGAALVSSPCFQAALARPVVDLMITIWFTFSISIPILICPAKETPVGLFVLDRVISYQRAESVARGPETPQNKTTGSELLQFTSDIVSHGNMADVVTCTNQKRGFRSSKSRSSLNVNSLNRADEFDEQRAA